MHDARSNLQFQIQNVEDIALWADFRIIPCTHVHSENGYRPLEGRPMRDQLELEESGVFTTEKLLYISSITSEARLVIGSEL